MNSGEPNIDDAEVRRVVEMLRRIRRDTPELSNEEAIERLEQAQLAVSAVF